MSRRETTRGIDQCVAPPTSMYSMNRTSAPWRASELQQVYEFVVVDTANDDRVELEPGKEGRGRGDTVEDALELVEPRQALETVSSQRVEADGQAVQARLAKRLGLGSEQHAIGGHGEVSDSRTGSQSMDEVRQIATQERLAAGQPDLVHAEPREDIDERFDFLEVQDVLAREPHVVRFGHAVAAAQVAAVGDRKTKVSKRTLMSVADHWIHYDAVRPKPDYDRIELCFANALDGCQVPWGIRGWSVRR